MTALPAEASQTRTLTPIEKIRHQLDAMASEFAMALPQHIPVDRFKRVVITAINADPKLLLADRRSLMGAAMQAAQDGLYPDKREGAFVIFNKKVKKDGKDEWIEFVQWMPMVYGIIKKMRNSGELSSIVAHPVYEKDKFSYVLGDDERIEHEPTLAEVRGRMVAVYAVAKLKDGTIQREVMPRAEVEKVRQASRAKDAGPWRDWYEEMARKTVVRRLSKYLPMSTEIEQILRRDDALYASASGEGAQIGADRTVMISHGTAAAQLDSFAGPMIEAQAEPEADDTSHDPETGEVAPGPKPADDERRPLLNALRAEAEACQTYGQWTAMLERRGADIDLILGSPAGEEWRQIAESKRNLPNTAPAQGKR